MGSGLVCVGLTTLDIVARPIDRLPEAEGGLLIEGIEVVPAGTAGGAAMVAATLGVSTRLVTAIGEDRPGRFVRMALEETGVDTSLITRMSGRRTSQTVLAVDSAGRRPNFHALGAGHFTEVTPQAIEAAKAARFVHWGGVGSPRLENGPGAELLAAARDAGATITLDLIAPQPSAMDELARLLPYVDYFMPSAAEALPLTGAENLDRAADVFLGMGARACIFKAGAEGSFVALGAERTRLPAHDITPLDTTSCGDSYCAGFIAALDHGWPVLEACRFATATAALVAQGLGTLGALTDFAATELAMRDMPLKEAA